MTDKPENKPIERLGRSIRTEMRTRATPEQAYHAWADANRWRALLTRLATRVAARRTDALKTTTGAPSLDESNSYASPAASASPSAN